MDGTGNGAVLTLPPGVPESEALGFLDRHKDWLRRALQRQPAETVVADGAVIPVDGIDLTVVVADGPKRNPRREGASLILSGQAAPGPRIAAWLKERARERMVPAVHRYAAEVGQPVRAISLKDTRSRWGSCSSAKRISLSWRLAMAPPLVQDYLCAHEAAHLAEMNHSPKYWSLVKRLMPDFEIHRQWLKQNGRSLHAFRFDA